MLLHTKTTGKKYDKSYLICRLFKIYTCTEKNEYFERKCLILSVVLVL